MHRITLDACGSGGSECAVCGGDCRDCGGGCFKWRFPSCDPDVDGGHTCWVNEEFPGYCCEGTCDAEQGCQ